MTNNTKHTRFGLSVAAVFTAMIMVTAILDSTINPAFAATTVGGRATAVSISSSLGPLTFMDSGPLTSPGEVDAIPIAINSPLVRADGLLAVATGAATASSQSAVGQLVLLPGNPAQITAYSVYSEADAACSVVSGYSDITSLTVGAKLSK